jgi:NAD(P)H-flavin reductase
MTVWHEGKVAASQPAAAGLHEVLIDVSGTPLVGTHVLPGQYIRVSVDEAGEGVFAIASAPDEETWHFELLVKRGPGLADTLVSAPIGTRVRLSTPEGPGFPLEKGRGHRVLLFATGSGISAIRSLIFAIKRERASFRDITLFFGARTPDAFAYQDELVDWQDEGINVVQTVSQAEAPGWNGLTGYVQSHLPEESLHDAVAFVCGQGQMVADVRAALTQRGMSDDKIYLNV